MKTRYLKYIICLCSLPVFLITVSGCGWRQSSNAERENIFRAKANDQIAANSTQPEKKRTHPDYLNLARALVKQSRYDIALVQLKEAEKKEHDNPEIFYLKGVCLRMKKDYFKAIAQYEKSLKIKPDYSYAHNGLGVVYDLMGEHKKAVACYQKAIEINPAGYRFYNNLGLSLLTTGKIEFASKNFEKSLSLNPGNPRAINNLGVAYGMMGKYDSALAEFNKAGTPADAYNNMGYVYECLNDFKNALVMYDKALKLKPHHQYAKENLARVKKIYLKQKM